MLPWWRIAAFAAFAIPITLVDLRRMRIPDALSLGGIVVVLALDVLLLKAPALSIVLEAAVGFGVFWLLRLGTRGKLGFGDVKYSVLIALSLGLLGWLTTIAVASVTGLIAALVLIRRLRVPLSTRIPFAPFLTFGAAVSIVMRQARFLS
ncbi:MAG TPA: A24 family peptidase [Spirochaetia bacterium]|nr:A24 family peptidase [Spirochaetia bacterium]